MSWPELWPQVRACVMGHASRTEVLAKVSDLRGCITSWDALARAWRRQVNAGAEQDYPEVHQALGATCRLQEHVAQPRVWVPATGRKHLVIPDTQVRPGVPLDHFRWIGRYIVDKGPDVVIHLGDHWDMPSLSSYESAVRKANKGLLKKADIDAGNRALEMLEDELVKGGFQPRVKVLLEGNHDGFASEGRIGRYLAENPQDEGLINRDMFADAWTGWTRHPFLEAVEIDSIHYCHLFPFSQDGRVTASALRQGASNALVQVKAMMASCTAGHKQGLDVRIHNAPLARHAYRGVIAGSCYLHNEEYMGPGNRHYRGLLVKHDVRPSNPNHYDLMEVSLEFLRRRYA